MSAQLRPTAATQRDARRVLEPMTLLHLDRVMGVEAEAYEFPWSQGNFSDSLASGCPASLLLADDGALLGYFVAMVGVDEWHLLNITVAPAHQGQGHGRFLLDHLMSLCRAQAAAMLWQDSTRVPSSATVAAREEPFQDSI